MTQTDLVPDPLTNPKLILSIFTEAIGRCEVSVFEQRIRIEEILKREPFTHERIVNMVCDFVAEIAADDEMPPKRVLHG